MTTVADMKKAVYGWLSKAMGKEHIFKIVLDSEFVAGNLIDATLDGEAINQVAFDTDHTTTLKKLAAEIQKTSAIFQCIVSGPLELTCQGSLKGHTVDILGPTVQGGITQPVATIEEIQAPLKVTVIEDFQNSPRPFPKPYAYFMIGAEREYPLEDADRGFNESGLVQRSGMRAVTVLVQVIGEGALQYIRDARRALHLQAVQDEFYQQYGMAIIDTMPIQNLTGFLETKVEERGQMDVRFAHTENYLEDSPWIETVEVESDINGIHSENIYTLQQGA